MALRRMLSKKEAADYCAIPYQKFSGICPVRPSDLGGVVRWDIKAIDRWIDSKNTNEIKTLESDDVILQNL